MEKRNQTRVTEFILLGFAGGLGLQISRFTIVLLTYIVSLLGNGVMIVIIFMDYRLHTPMYFFLWNVSVLETFNISNIVPLMLAHVFTDHTSIPLTYCFVQSFFFFYLAAIVFFLLPIMSFDRYVAICIPLRYHTIVNGRLCIQLVIAAWLCSLIWILYPVILIARLPFCGPNIINHFFCDSLSIVNLACTDTGFIKIIIAVSALILLLSTLGFIIISYIYIISAVLRIPSTSSRKRVFSTCSSHLALVTIGYGSAIFTEISPELNSSMEVYKTVHMFSSLMAALMNPFVYTLRNKQVKDVLKGRLHPFTNLLPL